MPQPGVLDNFIRGINNFDTDLLMVFYQKDTGKYDFCFLEAKYEQKWNNAQICNKLCLLETLFKQGNYGFVGDVYYIFYSDDIKRNAAAIQFAKGRSIQFQGFKGFYGIDVNPDPYGQGIIEAFKKNSKIETSVLAEHAILGGFNFNTISSQFRDDLSIKFNIKLGNFFTSIDYSFKNIYNRIKILSIFT